VEVEHCKKLDKGPNGDEWYISALLERPLV
jgi:hypothetical protein